MASGEYAYHWASNGCLWHYLYGFVMQNSVDRINLGLQSGTASTRNSSHTQHILCRPQPRGVKYLCVRLYIYIYIYIYMALYWFVWHYIYLFGVIFVYMTYLCVWHYIYVFGIIFMSLALRQCVWHYINVSGIVLMCLALHQCVWHYINMSGITSMCLALY